MPKPTDGERDRAAPPPKSTEAALRAPDGDDGAEELDQLLLQDGPAEPSGEPTPRPRRRAAVPGNGPRRPATRLATAAERPPARAPSVTGPARGRRERARRPRGRLVLLGLVMMLLTTGLGGYSLIHTGFFRVQRVEVRGAGYVADVDVALASGAVGRDLYQIDPLDVQQRVERLTGVRAATVVRHWPRGLVVAIEERIPVAAWQVGSVLYAVDAVGVVLEVIPDVALPLIVQIDSGSGLIAGDRVDADAVVLAAKLREVGPPATGQHVVRYEWSRHAGLEATTDQGVRVRLGDGLSLDYKLSVWRAIIEQARRDKFTVNEIDLRFGDRVYFR